jgi:chemotaxis protein MotB
MRSHKTAAPAEEAAPQGAPAWVFTWGNLATVMLAFFIVLYALGGGGIAAPAAPGAEGGEEPAATAAPASLSSIKNRIAAKLEAQGASSLVRFESVSGTLVIHLDASALYDSGRAEIKPQATGALDAVGSVLAAVGNQVRVEGHSDNVPVIPTPQFPDNWTLSSARATGVLRYLREFHQIPAQRLSVAAYAHTRPVADNDTEAGRAKNRRVDIVVLGR